MKEKVLIGAGLLLLASSSLFGAGEFTQLTTAANDGKDTIQKAIQSWLWVTSLIPFAVAMFLFFKVKDYQERQEEQGQYQPKVAKYAGLVFAVVGGFFIMYIVYGILGAALFGKGFNDMWNGLVIDFFRNLI